MKLVARLAVYAAALFVVVTARLPEPSPALPALRTPGPEIAFDPVRLTIGAVLVAGIMLELLRRRPVWH